MSAPPRCMQDDFSNFTLRPSSVTKCQPHQGAFKMTFLISPHVHLVWPSVSSTTPKFSCEVDARWLFKCHLASTQDDIWKVYKGKVLTQGAHEMTFQVSPCVHLAWPSTPKFSHARWMQDDFSNVTLHPCEMALGRCMGGNSCRSSSFGLGTSKR